jgi:transcriptional regulator with XRE-family HTH domain
MHIRLRYWRVRKGLSMPALAKSSCVSVSAIQQIEGGRNPHESTAGKLANGLGITLEELVRDEQSLQRVS